MTLSAMAYQKMLKKRHGRVFSAIAIAMLLHLFMVEEGLQEGTKPAGIYRTEAWELLGFRV